MTVYAGETVQVTLQATDFNGDPLTNTNVTSVKLTVVDSEATALVDDESMSWDGGEEIWIYMWDTTGIDPGSYRAQIIVTGMDNTVSWEYKTIRLTRPKSLPSG